MRNKVLTQSVGGLRGVGGSSSSFLSGEERMIFQTKRTLSIREKPHFQSHEQVPERKKGQLELPGESQGGTPYLHRRQAFSFNGLSMLPCVKPLSGSKGRLRSIGDLQEGTTLMRSLHLSWFLPFPHKAWFCHSRFECGKTGHWRSGEKVLLKEVKPLSYF